MPEASAVRHLRHVKLGHCAEVQEWHQEATAMQELWWEAEHVDSHGCILSTLSENLFLFHLTLLLNGHVMALAVGCVPSLRGPMFSSKPVHVGSVVDKGEQRQVFLPVLQFPLSVSFHHSFMYIYHQCYRNLTMDWIIKWHTLTNKNSITVHV
jgi:hypothetical protein